MQTSLDLRLCLCLLPKAECADLHQKSDVHVILAGREVPPSRAETAQY